MFVENAMHAKNHNLRSWFFGILALSVLMLVMPGSAFAQTDLGSPGGLWNMFIQGEGDPYTNVLLNQIFGPIFSVPDGGGFTTETLFSTVIKYFNVAMLVVGGVMFFNNLVTGTMQSAHEGVALGRSWSSLWGPLRSIFAVGLLLPIANIGGYNTAQLFMGHIAKNATQFASGVWSETVNMIVTGVLPVVAPRGTIPQNLAGDLFLLEMCRTTMNDQFAKSASNMGQADRVVRNATQAMKRVPFSTGGTGPGPTGGGGSAALATYQTRVTYDRVDYRGNVLTPSVCGSYLTPQIPDVINNRVEADTTEDFTLDAVMEGNTNSIRNMYQQMHYGVLGRVANGEYDGGLGLAMQQISEKTYASHLAQSYPAQQGQPLYYVLTNGSWQPRNGGAAPNVDIFDDVRAAVVAANERLDTGHQDLIEAISSGGTRNEGVRQAMVERITTQCAPGQSSCLGEGWIGAGSWYMMIARFNNEISSLFVQKAEIQTADQARTDVSERGGWFGWGDYNETDKELQKQYAESYKYGAEAFNSAANRMAAFGWEINPAMVTNVAATFNGREVETVYENNRSTESMNKHLLNILTAINEFQMGQDPMIGITSIGAHMVTAGSAMIVADLIIPGNISSTLGSYIATMGAGLSIVLPLMPFLFWIMAVTGYLMLVVEAFIAANLWALSHLKMNGEGITGEAGRHGWLMILSLMVTPFLMLGGYLVGMIIFRISAVLLSSGLSVAVNGVIGTGDMIFKAVACLVIVIFIFTFYLLLLERSFSLVSEFPTRVLRWMGAGADLGVGSVDRVRGAAVGTVGAIGKTTGTLAKNRSYKDYIQNDTNTKTQIGGS